MTVHAFASYLLAMMLAFTPAKEHSFYEPANITLTRYASISQTMAEVILAEPIADTERLKVGAVMVSIGDAESHWNAAVVSCAKGGDGDRAWGPWQTQLPKQRVCESTRSALVLALGMVKTSFLACKHLTVPDRLSWYTDGHCIADWKRSRWRMGRALSWLTGHPFTVNDSPFNAVAIIQ